MGLFGSDTHHKRVTYGQKETDMLQPWLYHVWRSMYGGGGNPAMPMIDMEIQAAYDRAAREAGAGMGIGARQAIQNDVRNRGNIAGDLLSGAVGMAGQQNLLNTAGQASGYLGALTAARPQFGFDSSTPWSNFMGGVGTLMQPAAMGMGVLQGRPDALTGMDSQKGLAQMGPGQMAYDPFAGARTFF